MTDKNKLADELHAFVAAAPHEYPGHLIELFDRAEKALRHCSAESAAGDRQISVMAALDPTEESDIDFLLDQIKNAPDRQAKRDAVRSFRKQMALVSCLIDTLPQSVARSSDRWLSDLLLGCTEIDVCTIDYATNQHVRYRLTDDQKAVIATSVIEGLAEQPTQSQAASSPQSASMPQNVEVAIKRMKTLADTALPGRTYEEECQAQMRNACVLLEMAYRSQAESDK